MGSISLSEKISSNAGDNYEVLVVGIVIQANESNQVRLTMYLLGHLTQALE